MTREALDDLDDRLAAARAVVSIRRDVGPRVAAWRRRRRSRLHGLALFAVAALAAALTWLARRGGRVG